MNRTKFSFYREAIIKFYPNIDPDNDLEVQKVLRAIRFIKHNAKEFGLFLFGEVEKNEQ